MAKVLIFILSLTAEGWLDVLLATRQQGSKYSSPVSSHRVLAHGIQATRSSVSFFGKNWNDTSIIELNSTSGSKSSNIKLSPSSPHVVLSSTCQSSTKTLPSFHSSSTSFGEASSGLIVTVSFTSLNSSTSTSSMPSDVSDNGYKTYMHRWVVFYVNIGGWIMLAVILCGILSLVFTHIQARRELRNANDLPLLTQRERLMTQYETSWI